MKFVRRLLLGLLVCCYVSIAAPTGMGQEISPEKTIKGEVWQYSVSPSLPPAAGKFQMEMMQERTFHYFWDLADPETGLIPDRYPSQRFCSIAAQGMGYACYVIGAEKGWVSRQQAADRVLASLRFFQQLPQNEDPKSSGYKGFYYHFLDMDTGQRFDKCELSSIDTTLLMGGVLVCESYFDGDNDQEREIREIAHRLVHRIDWQWMLTDTGHVCMGWKPESGFLDARWKGYDESILLHVIAAGSKDHAIKKSTYDKYCETYVWDKFYGQEHINFGPLFGHQYSQMFIDFRNRQDDANRKYDLNYFENARRATLSQIAYAKDNPKGFVGYDENHWGLTAGDGPGWGRRQWQGRAVDVQGYSARGIASNYDVDDGTLFPTAAGGSFPYTPEQSRVALANFWEMNDGKVVGLYGYLDSFNRTFVGRDEINVDRDPKKIWVNGDYIGIDQGPILIQTVNSENGLIWKLMEKNSTIQSGLKRIGFESKR